MKNMNEISYYLTEVVLEYVDVNAATIYSSL